jgi:predicted dehydrogenase
MPANKTPELNVGIIGTGIGTVHNQGYQNLPGVNVVAIVDVDPERAKRTAEEWGVPQALTNHEDLLNVKGLDAVSVCTPNSLHASVAIDALKAGKHVICEKPMAAQLDQAEALAVEADAATARGQVFMMGLNNRYRGDTQLLKQYIDAGDLGDLYLGKCGWVRRSGIPGMGGWFTNKELSGGGPLIDIGVHALDLCWWLMGAPEPTSVSASVFAHLGPKEWKRKGSVGTYDIEDAAVAHIRFANGAAIMLEASWILHTAKESLFCEVMGTEGGASVEPDFRIVKDMHGSPLDILPDPPTANGHEAEIAHFVECIVEGKTPISTARDGLAVQRMLDAVYRSGETNEIVKIGA